MKQSDIKDIVEKELAENPENIEKVERGLKQKTYRITVGNNKYILQLSDKVGEEDNGLERNIKAYQQLAETEIPVPALVTDEVKVYKKKSKQWKYYICECLRGENLEHQMTDDLTAESGRLLSQLHDFAEYEKSGWLVPDEEGFWVASFEEGSFKQYLLNEWQERIEILEEEGWNEVIEKSKNFYNKYKDEIPEDVDPVFCPNDFSTDNLLVKNGEITGVIDFDMAYAGHSYRDLVKSANAFWMINPEPESGMRELFYEGYQQGKELDNSFWRLEPIYRVETITQTVASLVKMNHFNQEEKEFYQKHLPRTIEEAEGDLEKLKRD